jgi:hypothetical protein
VGGYGGLPDLWAAEGSYIETLISASPTVSAQNSILWSPLLLGSFCY